MFFQRLWFKLVVGTLLLIAIFTGFLVYSAFQDFRQEVTHHEEILLRGEVSNLAILLDSILTEQLNLGSTLPFFSEVSYLLKGEDLQEEVKEILANVKENNRYIMGIRVIDRDGEIIGTSDSGLGVDLSDRDYFLAAMDGKQFISSISISRVTGNLFYAVASPVFYEGESIGATSLVIDWSQMVEDVFVRDSQRLTGESIILDEEGYYLAHGDSSVELLADSILAHPFGEEILSFEGGFFESGEGRDRVWIAQSFLSTGWRILSFDEESSILSQVFANRRRSIIILSISLFVLGFFLFFFLSRLVIHPLNTFNGVIGKLKEGDLKVGVDVQRRDELGEMASNLRSTISSLHKMVQGVESMARDVLHTSRIMSQDNQDLAQRTEEQATALEQVSSSIKDMSSTLMDSSSNATEADTLTNQTLESVKRGEGVIKEMQGAMEEITKGNRDISEIIATVNDIAFQTNLLALNAAVEAARAGEEGRGFAVVASEVRNLAHRTTESSKEIEDLIKSSFHKVTSGNRLMQETEEVLQGIVNNTREIAQLVGEIASSLKEQSQFSKEINSSIKELDEVTQQNASMVESIASSSQKMQDLADELASKVDAFNL